MSANSKIEWCDHTFNAWFGCTKVSPGCDHCYAERSLPAKFFRVQWGAGEPRWLTSEANWKTAHHWNRQHAAFYARHGHRQRVFCNSLGDVMDKEVPVSWRVDLFRLMLLTQNLDWLVLTKRIGNAAGLIEEVLAALREEGLDVPAWPWANVWLGATIVNQEEADRDIGKLLATPAAVRFLSIEPLLSAVTLPFDQIAQWNALAIQHEQPWAKARIDWVIVGGESGPQARPLHPLWVQALCEQCVAAGVAFFFKQWGHWQPISQGLSDWFAPLYRSRRRARAGQDQAALDDIYGRVCTVPYRVVHVDGTVLDGAAPMAFREGTQAMMTYAVGKEQAGRQLDGREWNETPLASVLELAA